MNDVLNMEYQQQANMLVFFSTHQRIIKLKDWAYSLQCKSFAFLVCCGVVCTYCTSLFDMIYLFILAMSACFTDLTRFTYTHTAFHSF